MVDYSEHWKSFFDNENYIYEVNILGQLRKTKKSNNENYSITNINFDKNNFKYISFGLDDGSEKRVFIDEIVAELFLLNKPDFSDLYVLHKNCNLLDNEATNLEYVSIEYAKKNNLPMRQRPIPVNQIKKTISIQQKFFEDVEEKWKKYFQYEISNFGNVRFFKDKKIITEFNNINGFLTLTGFSHTYIHKKVAEFFVPCNLETEYKMVLHKDGNKHNNYFGNLQWVNKNDLYKDLKKNYRENHKIEKKTPMTNAERQRKFREKQKLSKSLQN